MTDDPESQFQQGLGASSGPTHAPPFEAACDEHLDVFLHRSGPMGEQRASHRADLQAQAVHGRDGLGMAPFGALLDGAVANRLGAPLTVALGALVCLAGSFVFGSRWPAMRGEARQLSLAQGMSCGEPPEEMTGHAVFFPAEEGTGGRPETLAQAGRKQASRN